MKIIYKTYTPIDRYTMLEREEVLYCASTFESGGLTYCKNYSGYICAVIDTANIKSKTNNE